MDSRPVTSYLETFANTKISLAKIVAEAKQRGMSKKEITSVVTAAVWVIYMGD